jgi:hypothetical protein
MEKTLFKTIFIISCAILSYSSCYSQTWQWAKKGAGTNNEFGGISCTDPSGNIIATGIYTSNPIQIGSFTLANMGTGTGDAFIAKYNSNGTVLWAQRLGGTNQEIISGITTDALGNIYVLGNFSSSSISNSTLSVTNTTTTATMDIFVAVFNPSGNILSLKSYGGIGNDFGGGCAYSNSLNMLFISGRYNSVTATFGSNTLTNTDGTGTSSDIFLASISSFVTFNWVTSTGSGSSNDAAVDLALDASSNPYFSGTFYNSSTFTTSIANTTLTTIGGQDIIFAKYSSTGTAQWAKNFGTNFSGANDFSGGISIDASNNIFLSGYSNNSSLIAGTFTLTNSGGNDAFVAKTNSVGVFQWVNAISALGDQYVMRNTLDAFGNIYVAGSFSGTNTIVGTTTLTNSNPGTSTDGYVIKYNSAGVAQWANSISGANNESAAGISCDNLGNIYVAGTYSSGIASFGTNTLSLDGGTDSYIAKIGSCLSTTISGTSTICAGLSTTLIASGATNYTWSTGATSSLIVVTPSTTTSYTLTGNTGSCTAINPAPFVVTVLPASINAGADFSLSCGQTQIIPATTNPTSPINVVWTPTTALSNSSVLSPSVNANLGAINYTVTATLSNGCVAKDEITITTTVTPPQLCLVSVDSLGINNEIYWDKTLYTKVDSFIVYRETAISVYSRIAALHKSAFSMFVDTSRSVGGSNNGDPKYTSYRYKLQIRDSCGNYSDLNLSLYHQTMFVQDQQNSNFTWNPYAIESSASPVSNYVLNRRDIITGATTTVAATTANSISDPMYSSLFAGNVKWYVDAVGFNCNATAKINNTLVLKTRTKSNQSNEKTFPTIGIQKHFFSSIEADIYPNPTSDIITINLKGANVKDFYIEVKNIIGETVLLQENISNSQSLSLSQLAKGVYFLNIKNGNSLVVVKKITVN